MNETISTKCRFAPENLENTSLNPKDRKYFQEIYDFARIRKIENNQWEMKNIMKNWIEEKTFRIPLNFAEKVLVLAEMIRKKDTPGRLYKSSTENIPFLNTNRVSTIYKRANLENETFLYWLEEDGWKVKGRFLRQELFALNNQFLRWDLFLYILEKIH